jgi:hypothetical protein
MSPALLSSNFSVTNPKRFFRLREYVVFLPMQFPKKHIPVEEGDFYLTPEGYRCFTAQYHLKRGYCCDSNCRHCPYKGTPKT